MKNVENEVFEMCSAMKVSTLDIAGDGFILSGVGEDGGQMAIMPMQDPNTSNAGYIFYEKLEDGYVVYGEHECFFGADLEEQVERAHRAYRAQDMAFKFVEVHEGTL